LDKPDGGVPSRTDPLFNAGGQHVGSAGIGSAACEVDQHPGNKVAADQGVSGALMVTHMR
jgi:hypothetical protein